MQNEVLFYVFEALAVIDTASRDVIELSQTNHSLELRLIIISEFTERSGSLIKRLILRVIGELELKNDRIIVLFAALTLDFRKILEFCEPASAVLTVKFANTFAVICSRSNSASAAEVPGCSRPE